MQQRALTNGRIRPGHGRRRRIQNHAAFIWSVADLLRGDYKQSEYGKVILPLVVLRRLDCVLEPTKDAGPRPAREARGQGRERRAGPRRRSPASSSTTPRARPSTKLLDDPTQRRRQPPRLHRRLLAEARATSSTSSTSTPRSTGSTGRTCSTWSSSKFAEIDLHPDAVSNIEMGYLYEELIRRFSELSNETAGEHFTPREVIRLMVNLLFIEDDDAARQAGHRADDARPGLRHRRDALGRRGPPPRAEPRRAARGVRPGAERRDLRDLPLRHDAQGPGRLATSPRQLLHRGRPSRARASTTCSPTRRSAWSGRRSRTRSETSTTSSASPVASGPGCRASTTARSCSSST